jgi:hypothetical protein
MATFTAVITYHFDTEYEVEAGSYEEAEQRALEEATEWLPYSSVKGYTHDWYQVEVEVSHLDGELDED